MAKTEAQREAWALNVVALIGDVRAVREALGLRGGGSFGYNRGTKEHAKAGYHRFDTFLGQLIITGVISAVGVAVFAVVWLLYRLRGWMWAGLGALKRWMVG